MTAFLPNQKVVLSLEINKYLEDEFNRAFLIYFGSRMQPGQIYTYKTVRTSNYNRHRNQLIALIQDGYGYNILIPVYLLLTIEEAHALDIPRFFVENIILLPERIDYRYGDSGELDDEGDEDWDFGDDEDDDEEDDDYWDDDDDDDDDYEFDGRDIVDGDIPF